MGNTCITRFRLFQITDDALPDTYEHVPLNTPNPRITEVITTQLSILGETLCLAGGEFKTFNTFYPKVRLTNGCIIKGSIFFKDQHGQPFRGTVEVYEDSRIEDLAETRRNAEVFFDTNIEDTYE